MISDLETIEDFDKALEASESKPLFILKHSTACGTSAHMWTLFQDLADEMPDVEFRRILVREHKPVSDEIASRLGIQHESPQMILIYKGKVVWHASHWSISRGGMINALDSLEIEN
jgi:bacillithiol system protein YtxJ